MKPLVRDADDLLQLLDRTGNCWLWTRARHTFGYGQVSFNGRQVGAHRLAYQLLVGPIPEGCWVLHSCDNPPCCNPSHLSIGSPADNSAEMRSRGRSCRGARNPNVKLDEVQVREIKSRLARGDVQRKIARDFRVTPQAVWLINRGINWAHVSADPPFGVA